MGRDIEQLKRDFAACGQAHVFDFWDRLDATGRERLLQQAQRLAPDLESLVAAERAAAGASEEPANRIVEPGEAIALPAHGGDPALAERARQRGEEILRQGKLAVFLVAGGQGTRLGFDGPKGCFPIGPVTDRTMFEIQAQKIRGLARRAGCRVPWYIMTSDATDGDTREVFERRQCFGIDPADVRIFHQEMVPAFSFEGRMLLERPDRIFESPNGHGGALTALESSGSLDDMEDRGIDTIFYFQVDNPLVKIGDPTYLGFHADARAEMSCKVVRKVDPAQKVGVVARVDGRVSMVEYTELRDRQRFARDADGQLVFWAGNVAIHLLSTGFVRRVAANAGELLPYHVSAKKIPTVDSEGRPVHPDEPNGNKLERFVFDALPAADGVCVVETDPSEEFSPIKNASGASSPESSRRALIGEYRRWLELGGLDLPPEDRAIEIDHSRIDGPEEAAAAGYRSLAEARDVIRVASGRDS
jgi:UDP-N-acetylglucosamine/UDP-N-acetylgalactosamine diphosphorylase